jgi:hypothetical protein
MPRYALLAATACALLLAACSTPQCPRNQIQHGMTCSHCPEGSEKKGNQCLTSDGGVVVEPVEGDEDGGDEGDGDADLEADVEAGASALDATVAAASMDATSAEASSEAGPAREFALGTAGAPCSAELEQTLACEGHASRKILKCQAGAWQVLQTCSMSERCDSRVGTEQGTCATIPAACVGKSTGDICDGLVRLECGADLVTVTLHACDEHLHCESTPNVHCACDTGYQDDGHGACGNPDDCPAGACSGGKCVDGLSDYSCDCNSGFAGTGTKKCTAVLYCPKDACTPGGSCVDTMNWSCQCGSGFSGTGTQACANQNDCPSNRCLAPNGTCQDQVGTYRCNCNPGFSGPDCVNDICGPNPCKNGGTCSRTGMLCACPAGYSGASCQTDVCNPNPCQHGGTCNRGTSASCTCTGTGYQGDHCEVAVDPCSGTTNACGGSCMSPLAHQLNEACSNGLLGACARTGKYVCQGTGATVCNAPSVAASTEACGDGVDNDCDGSVDEADAVDATVWYEDCDGDGYSALTAALIVANTGVRRSCTKPDATSSCPGGWTATRPQAPQTGIQPVNWDCDDASPVYNPNADFGLPPDGKTRTDLNCDGIDQAEPAVTALEWIDASLTMVRWKQYRLCLQTDSCEVCSNRGGYRWVTQPPCSTSNSQKFDFVGPLYTNDFFNMPRCENGEFHLYMGGSGGIQRCR